MSWSLLFNTETLLKKGLEQVFPVNFAKFLRTPFLQNKSRQLLLLGLQLYQKWGSVEGLFQQILQNIFRQAIP